ncbi:MAG: hypothetical protein K5Q00_02165 [Gammaproteobacteria bacterium]|nr:hypothetical protein [Gammaproteobacteria bacterium]
MKSLILKSFGLAVFMIVSSASFAQSMMPSSPLPAPPTDMCAPIYWDFCMQQNSDPRTPVPPFDLHKGYWKVGPFFNGYIPGGQQQAICDVISPSAADFMEDLTLNYDGMTSGVNTIQEFIAVKSSDGVISYVPYFTGIDGQGTSVSFQATGTPGNYKTVPFPMVLGTWALAPSNAIICDPTTQKDPPPPYPIQPSTSK